MDISGAINTAVIGMERSSQQVSQASTEIAQASVRDAERQQRINAGGTETATQTPSESEQSVNANASVTDALVDLNVGKNLFQANGRVLESADEMLGTLIDTTA